MLKKCTFPWSGRRFVFSSCCFFSSLFCRKNTSDTGYISKQSIFKYFQFSNFFDSSLLFLCRNNPQLVFFFVGTGENISGTMTSAGGLNQRKAVVRKTDFKSLFLLVHKPWRSIIDSKIVVFKILLKLNVQYLFSLPHCFIYTTSCLLFIMCVCVCARALSSLWLPKCLNWFPPSQTL